MRGWEEKEELGWFELREAERAIGGEAGFNKWEVSRVLVTLPLTIREPCYWTS